MKRKKKNNRFLPPKEQKHTFDLADTNQDMPSDEACAQSDEPCSQALAAEAENTDGLLAAAEALSVDSHDNSEDYSDYNPDGYSEDKQEEAAATAVYGSFHEPDWGKRRDNSPSAPKAEAKEETAAAEKPRQTEITPKKNRSRKMTNKGKLLLFFLGLLLLLAAGLVYSCQNDPGIYAEEKDDTALQDDSNLQDDAVLEDDPLYQPQSEPGADNSAGADTDINQAEGTKDEQSAPVAALTFDDGPSAEVTPLLAEALRQRGVKATFFVLGKNAAAYPEIIKQMAEAGHQIASHTYDHAQYLTRLQEDHLAAQVNDTIAAVRNGGGGTPAFIRPPYGVIDKATAGKIGWPLMLWTVDPRDWDSRDAQKVYDAVMDNVEDGSVILLHDIYDSTYEAAIMIVDELLARGWRFVTLEEYYQLYDIEPLPGHVYRGKQEVIL